MVTKYNPESEEVCRESEPMRTTFEAKTLEDDLVGRRFALLTNFFRFPGLGLEKVEEEIGKAVKNDLEGGVFGSYVESILMSSFWWLNKLRSVIPEQTADMRGLILRWHGYLNQAVAYEVDEKYRFCGFSTIEDIGINLTQDVIDVLTEVIPIWEGKTAEEVQVEAQRRADRGVNREGSSLDDKVYDGIDVIASLLVLMRRAGLKPAIADERLQDFLHSFMEGRIPVGDIPGDDNGAWKERLTKILTEHYQKREKPKTTLGGAAGNQAFLFREMGFQALIHMPYHHENQAQEGVAPRCAKRLVLGKNGPAEKSISEGDPNDPRRLSFVFNLIPKDGKYPTLKIGNLTQTVTRKQPDRVIFRKPRPIKEKQAGSARNSKWKTLRVVWKGKGVASWKRSKNKWMTPGWDDKQEYWSVEIGRDEKDKNGDPIFKEWNDEEWPLFYLFQYPAKFDRKTRTLTIELADPGDLQPIVGKIRTAILGGIDQMGFTVLTPALTALLREALPQQLKTFSDAGVKMNFEIARPIPGETLDNLKELFNKGGLKSVSVNREELSQITSEYGSTYYAWAPPAPSERQLAIYRRAVHLGDKMDMGTVFVHDPGLDILIRRNEKEKPPTGQPDSDEEALTRHRQSLLLAKAAVPEAFYRRAEEKSEWHLVLSKQSLYELLIFAKDYAEMAASEYSTERRKKIRAEIEKSIIEKGYWRTEGKNSFSVVVSPTIFLELPPTVNMAGAGDQNAAAHQAVAPA